MRDLILYTYICLYAVNVKFLNSDTVFCIKTEHNTYRYGIIKIICEKIRPDVRMMANLHRIGVHLFVVIASLQEDL